MAPTAPKPYFYYGHRAPSQNRPTVHSRIPLSSPKSRTPKSPPTPISFPDWAPHSPHPSQPPPTSTPSHLRRLSPLTRHLLDLLLLHRRWSPSLLSDLRRLRRLTPHLLADLLRHAPHHLLSPHLLSRLFHFASRQKNFNPTYSLFNALAYSLHRHNLHRSADHLPHLMSSLGKPPTEKQLEILVRFHSDSGRGLRIHHIYRTMRANFNIKPRIFLFNRILDGLIKTRHLDLALEVYSDMKRDGVKEEAITFAILAKGFCREGRVAEAVEVLEKMRHEICRPDVFVYTAMVKVLAENGDFDGCLRVWEEMERDGVEADAMAYGTMVSGLCGDGRVERGLELFREMKKRGFLVDRSVYGALVSGFVKAGEVEKGCWVLKEMVVDGCRPDLGIYDCLIKGLCEDGRVDKACKLFQIVVSERISPGFETVMPLLASFVELNEMDRFFRLVDRIADLGLPVMDHLAGFFSVFVGKRERKLRAVEVFEGLKGKGYCSVAIHNVLIEALYKSNEGKKAVMLFEEMRSLKTLEPDSCTFSLVIPCYVDAEDVREACSCYNKMKEMSWTPSVVAYCALVKGLCRTGEINGAITLVKDCLGSVMNGPMEFKYALTILNVCRSRKPEKVIEVLDEMREEGYLLEDIIYCAVIHGFCKHASSEEARKVLEVMKNRNILSEANYIVYEDMLNEHLKKVTASLVISSLKFFGLESKVKPTSKD